MIRAKEGESEKILSFQRVLQYSQSADCQIWQVQRDSDWVFIGFEITEVICDLYPCSFTGVLAICSRFMWIIWWLRNSKWRLWAGEFGLSWEEKERMIGCVRQHMVWGGMAILKWRNLTLFIRWGEDKERKMLMKWVKKCVSSGMKSQRAGMEWIETGGIH